MVEFQETLFYSIVLLSLVPLFLRLRMTQAGLLIVLIFWSGLFAYMGSTVFSLYKIFIVVYALVLWGPKILKISTPFEKYVNISFALFTIIFWISYLLQGGAIITMMSQYGYKYGLVFLMFHGLKDIQYNLRKRDYIKKLLLYILFIQVFLSVTKIFIFGFDHEAHVGSMAFDAGGIAVVIPIVALIFYWLIKNDRLEAKDWLIISSFFIIAIASGKRAPIILYPVFIFLLVGSVRTLAKIQTAMLALPVLIIIFYLGVRLTPSFNPEEQVWGSFDLVHVKEYVIEYNFGTINPNEILAEDYRSSGRGGSLLLLFEPQRLGFRNSHEFLFGRGLYHVVIAEEGRFLGGVEYGIDHHGLIGAIVMDFYTLGLLGMLSVLFLAYTVIRSSQYSYIKWILFAFFIWEYMFYGNLTLFDNASGIIIVFICFYSNTIHLNIKKNKRITQGPEKNEALVEMRNNITTKIDKAC